MADRNSKLCVMVFLALADVIFNGFLLSTVKLEWTVAGLISKDTALLSLKICIIAPFTCDYLNEFQIFDIRLSLEIHRGNVKSGQKLVTEKFKWV